MTIINKISEWNPTSPESWAQTLGMVYVPMFGTYSNAPQGQHSVLLDGMKASLSMSSTDDDELAYSNDPLSWSWSANMRHTVFINNKRGTLLVKRWDAPSYAAPITLPKSPSAALSLLSDLEQSRRSRLPDVVSYMLKAFRIIRSSIIPYSQNPVDIVRVFNAFLSGSESARAKEIDEAEWRRSKTVGDALSLLTTEDTLDISEITKQVPIGVILDFFMNPDPLTQYQLEPELLIRHASGSLYQEAHFEIERQITKQLSFPGLGSIENPIGNVKRDARFTPPSLARTIVQQTLDAMDAQLWKRQILRILDPACGSGIFLQEALRELISRGFKGNVVINGYDTSEISCLITRFCLKHTIKHTQTSGLHVQVNIEQRDALSHDWGLHDVIVMNPPFMNWQRMSEEEKYSVRQILGTLAIGHIDKAMAFFWKAVQHLEAGGGIGSILPSPFLNSNSGTRWRKALLEISSLSLVGKFTGYGYFPGAIVEPAFVVMKRYLSSAQEENNTVQVVLAEEGAEDNALRSLRRHDEPSLEDGVEILQASRGAFTAGSWLPRSKLQIEFITMLRALDLPTVGDLFTVRQGIRTGDNNAFILQNEELQMLPKSERQFFRPIAGTKTIAFGRITYEQYVFYPYDSRGLIIKTEEALQKQLRHYYERYLQPSRSRLVNRSRILSDQWWKLTWERSWQWKQHPKIVTKYFGHSGSFAYDSQGAFVVGQGYAWLWRKQNDDMNLSAIFPSSEDEVEDILDVAQVFDNTPLPWAYVALLNSPIFMQVLEHFCPKVQGGQFNLASQFIHAAFLPDISDGNLVRSETVRQLADLGRIMSTGKLVDSAELSRLAAEAYSIPLEVWGINQGY